MYKECSLSKLSVPVSYTRTAMLHTYSSRLFLFVPFLALVSANSDVEVRAADPQTSGISVLQCILNDPLVLVQCCQTVGPVGRKYV